MFGYQLMRGYKRAVQLCKYQLSRLPRPKTKDKIKIEDDCSNCSCWFVLKMVVQYLSIATTSKYDPWANYLDCWFVLKMVIEYLSILTISKYDPFKIDYRQYFNTRVDPQYWFALFGGH